MIEVYTFDIYITIIINIYVRNEGEKRLSIIMLLEIMPYFPYSANRVELIHFARPSIIHYRRIQTRLILSHGQIWRTRETALLVINYDSPQCRHSRTVTVLFKCEPWRFVWRKYRSHIRWGLWWEDIFLNCRSFTYACSSRERFESAIKVAPAVVAKRVHPRFEEEESPSRLSVEILANERVRFISDRLTAMIHRKKSLALSRSAYVVLHVANFLSAASSYCKTSGRNLFVRFCIRE